MAKYIHDFDFELEFLIGAQALHVRLNAVEECLIRIRIGMITAADSS